MLTQLMALILRCYAVWLGLQSIRAVGALFEINEGKAQSAAALLGLSSIELGVATALWFFPFSIARKLCRPAENADFSGLTPGGVYSAGMVLLGLYWISGAIYGAFYWVAYIALAGSNTHGVPTEGPDPFSLTMTVVELVIGLGLILGRRGLKRAILAMRYKNDAQDDF